MHVLLKDDFSMKKIIIIPTGDEICEGILIDTNSPKIIARLIEKYPTASIKRNKPVRDKKKLITKAINQSVQKNYQLILTVGGTGGGGKSTKSLANDYSHESILKLASDYETISIYGYNGHLWSKIVVALIKNSLIITLPGPQIEALAALDAALNSINEPLDKRKICDNIANAVINKYPHREGKSAIRYTHN